MESKGDHQKPPRDDQIIINRLFDVENKCIKVTVQIKKPGWVIKSLIAMSESMFEGGIQVVQPLKSNDASNELSLELRSCKFTDDVVELKLVMGAGANAPHFLISERKIKVNKFAYMMPIETDE